MNPLFPQGYDLTGTIYDYVEPGYRRTIKEQLKRSTVYNLDPEILRRFVGLQLDLYENEGVFLGPGTGQRDDNPEIASGTSWHQAVPYNATNKQGARAIDTVGMPTHEVAWAAMQRGYLNKYGFASFKKGTNQFNYTGIAAKVNDDPPHIQAYEDPYSRPRTGIKSLTKWTINPRYDLELLDLDNPLPPVVIPPTPENPVGDEDMGILIVDNLTGQYLMVDSGGITGVPNFTVRDFLFNNGIIKNKDPYGWSHEDVVAMLGAEDQDIQTRLAQIEGDLTLIKNKLGV